MLGLLLELLAQVGSLVSAATGGALLARRAGLLRSVALGVLALELFEAQRLGRRLVFVHDLQSSAQQMR